MTSEAPATSKADIEEEKAEQYVSKPGMVQNVKLFLVDPQRFVVEFNAPKKLGQSFPVYYDLIIQRHVFQKVAIQYKADNDSKAVNNSSNKDKKKKTKSKHQSPKKVKESRVSSNPQKKT